MQQNNNDPSGQSRTESSVLVQAIYFDKYLVREDSSTTPQNIGRFISEYNNQFEGPSTKHILLLKEYYKNLLIMSPVNKKNIPIDVCMIIYTSRKKVYEFL